MKISRAHVTIEELTHEEYEHIKAVLRITAESDAFRGLAGSPHIRSQLILNRIERAEREERHA